MQRKIYLIIIACILMTSVSSASINDYYIAPWGNNDNTGLSIEQAWKDLSWAVGSSGKVGAGTTIYVVNGTYYDPGTITFTTNNDGNETHPVLITAYNGTPIFDGGGEEESSIYAMLIGQSGYDAYSIQHITISNLTFRRYLGLVEVRNAANILIQNVTLHNSSVLQSYALLEVKDGCRDIVIDSSSFGATGYNSINVQGNLQSTQNPTYNITVSNNDIYDNAEHWAIQFGENVSAINVLNNYIHDNPYGGGIDLYKGYPNVGATNFIIRGNIIEDAYLMVLDGEDGIIEDTIIRHGLLQVFGHYYSNDPFTNENLTFRNITLENPLGFIDVSEGKNILFDRMNCTNVVGAITWKIWKNSVNITIRDEIESLNKIRLLEGGSVNIEFTDNTVFEYNLIAGSSENIVPATHYPNLSNFSQSVTETNTTEFSIKKYGMTAVPDTKSCTVTVNSFDTSLGIGNKLINFTANAEYGTNVKFTISGLNTGTNYIIQKDSTNMTSVIANSTGHISFTNSEWSEHTFTIEEASGSLPIPSNSDISITPATQTVAPNTSFTLTIPITPATPITGAQFDLLFDNSLATVTSVTEGNLLNQDGATTLFNSGTINNAAGTVTNVYGSILGETSVSSQGSFATISMTAGSTTGYLNLDLTNVKISDADSNAAPYTPTNATILIDTAPVLDNIGAKSVDEESALTFTTSAIDADGDSLTYTATNLPAGASLNTATGAFSWTPADGEAGTYVVTFEVTDGYISDSEAVTITVNDANNAPVITTFVPENSLTYNESDVITIGIIASDADGQALTYNIKIDGVTKSTSSSYVWETDYSSAGSHTIDITVSDGVDQVTDQRTITVNDVRPRWDVNEDGTVNVLDISIIGQKYGASVGAPYPRWDVNQDGVINVQDMTLAGSHFGETVA